MPRFDPWNNKRFGFPRKDAPAFQREWMPISSSGVQLTTITTDAQTLVKATSSVGVSGTLYIWGMSLCTTSTNAQAIAIKDDEDNTITSVVATANGPYFLQLSTPIQVPINSKLRMERLTAANADADTYCTINYTSARLNYES